MENIELRSEGIRKIIGKIPPLLIRSGIGIIALITILLLAVATFVPYPDTLEGQIVIVGITQERVKAEGLLPYSRIAQIKPGMKVKIEMEGYDARKYGYQYGMITNIDPKVITLKGENFFSFTATLQNSPLIRQGMKGETSIILSNKTLLGKIIRKR